MDLRDLYQDIILDHGRRPRNFRALPAPSHLAHGHNSLCGDRVSVYLRLDGDIIADVSFEGKGCAISTASASLMTEILKGRSVADAEMLFRAFRTRVTTGEEMVVPPALEDDLERLDPLTGVKSYPARVKCATLAWHALEAALRGQAADNAVKTE